MSLNSVTLTGRLGSAPETKTFESGAIKVRASLAVDKHTKDEKKTHWIDIEVWGKAAEALATYGKKGDAIGVSGSLETNTYEKDGQKVKRVFVHVDRIELLTPLSKNKEEIADSADEADF